MPGWSDLLADLEREFSSALDDARDSEVAERTRHEWGRLGFADRLAVADSEIGCIVDGVGRLSLRVAAAGDDWLLGADARGSLLVHLAAVTAVEGLGARARDPETRTRVEARIDLRFLLRRLVRDRTHVQVWLRSGTSYDGRLQRVGRDHVDVVVPRERDVMTVTVPLTALAMVRDSATG